MSWTVSKYLIPPDISKSFNLLKKEFQWRGQKPVSILPPSKLIPHHGFLSHWDQQTEVSERPWPKKGDGGGEAQNNNCYRGQIWMDRAEKYLCLKVNHDSQYWLGLWGNFSIISSFKNQTLTCDQKVETRKRNNLSNFHVLRGEREILKLYFQLQLFTFLNFTPVPLNSRLDSECWKEAR